MPSQILDRFRRRQGQGTITTRNRRSKHAKLISRTVALLEGRQVTVRLPDYGLQTKSFVWMDNQGRVQDSLTECYWHGDLDLELSALPKAAATTKNLVGALLADMGDLAPEEFLPGEIFFEVQAQTHESETYEQFEEEVGAFLREMAAKEDSSAEEEEPFFFEEDVLGPAVEEIEARN